MWEQGELKLVINLYTKTESIFQLNAPRFSKERCFLDGSQASSVSPSGNSSVKMINTE